MGFKGDIVVEALEKYPDLPSLTMAKMLYKNNKEVWNSVDNVRSLIRKYRGKSGVAVKSDTRFIEEGNRSPNPFESLPEGIKELGDWKPYYVKGSKILGLFDVHVPYHDKHALMTALEYGYKVGVDSVLLGGDFSDCYSVSFWEKDPRRRNFNEELVIVKETLKIIRDGFPDATIVYKLGNHEERYIRHMRIKSPELINVDVFKFENVLGLSGLKISTVKDKRICKVGALNVLHGHEFGGCSTAVNPARGFYLKGNEHILGGHFHKSSSHSDNSINDNFTGCWSVGCLCDMHPEYAVINKWNHGFAVIERDGKEFQVENKKIVNNKAYSA